MTNAQCLKPSCSCREEFIGSLTSDFVSARQCDRNPCHRCCPSCRRTATGTGCPSHPAGRPPSLGSHPRSSLPTRTPRWSASAARQQGRRQQASSLQLLPVVPWLDTNRLRTLARDTKVDETVISKICSRAIGGKSPIIRVQCDMMYPGPTVCRPVYQVAKVCVMEQLKLQHICSFREAHWIHH